MSRYIKEVPFKTKTRGNNSKSHQILKVRLLEEGNKCQFFEVIYLLIFFSITTISKPLLGNRARKLLSLTTYSMLGVFVFFKRRERYIRCQNADQREHRPASGQNQQKVAEAVVKHLQCLKSAVTCIPTERTNLGEEADSSDSKAVPLLK